MKRLLNILVFFCLPSMAFAQEETRVVDSLLSVVDTQEGREKVKTMIELTWEFYDVSYDDCLDWGEKAIMEAREQGFVDMEAKSNYVLGLQYAYHGDLDLAKEYLQKSYQQYIAINDTENAFESLWDIATYELTLGNMDTAYSVYEKALSIAEDDYYYARACIYSNMGLIWQNKDQKDKAFKYYYRAKQLFDYLDDKLMSSRRGYDIANICLEQGRAKEAKTIFIKILSILEECEDNYYSIIVCKGISDIYANDIINFDSSFYYLEKAIRISERPAQNKEREVLIEQEKSSILVRMGNLLIYQKNYEGAIEKYNEAIQIAVDQNYIYGQMEVFVGLIQLYSQLGQASKSLHYYERYAELEKTSGITLMRPSLRKYLAMDYARLGRFDDLYVIISEFEEENTALIRENADIYSQLQQLKDETADLLSDRESQSAQIQTFQTQRNHYRLAFFGLLAIVLSASVLFVLYKIVRKKRSKV